MRFVPSTRFKKQYRKLSWALQTRVDERLRLFSDDPFSPLLNNHSLHGEHGINRSINVGGDYRIVYCEVEKSLYLLIEVSTHSELYS
jgi:mRNA-degrading endonuclease YafQ of YafQ-DinJ toxin-antitoxin module